MSGFTKMVDMANTPEDIKEDVGGYSVATPSAPPSGPLYPFGLCLRLTEKELAKIGLDGEKPEVGDLIHLFAMAKVTSYSENQSEGTDGSKQSHCCVELQITHLGAEDEDNEDPDERIERNEARDKARSDSLYADDDEETEE